MSKRVIWLGIIKKNCDNLWIGHLLLASNEPDQAKLLSMFIILTCIVIPSIMYYLSCLCTWKVIQKNKSNHKSFLKLDKGDARKEWYL